MPPVADTANAAERPLPVRRRPDLVVRPQWFRQQRHWLVKDPLALQYFHLLDEEYAIFAMLDGTTSLAEIQRRFQERFAPRRLSLRRLQHFLGELHQRGLVLADVPGQGTQLQARRAEHRRRAWAGALGNLLAIRLPGLDADPLLTRLAPRCRWLFSRAALVLWGLTIGVAAILLAAHFDRLLAKLPAFHSFFSTANLLPLAVTVAGIKVLHELGHAVACKRFGGECHEIGVMLLLFTPCLYCDVTDAWTLTNRWHRMAVSAAGVYVELWIAAVCAFLWWFSEPGGLNALCLNAMFVCSVSTLVFNGNPLMRFDGYYVLADLVEVPNLQARAQAAGTRLLARWWLGVDLPGERVFTKRGEWLLAGYAGASIVYRWLVVIGAFFFLSHVLKPYHLEVLAQTFMIAAVVGMAAVPVRRLAGWLRNPVMRQKIKRGRLLWTNTLVLLVAAAVLLIPLPHHVAAPLVLQPQDARYVYVPDAGLLQDAVRVGATVDRDAVLARLADPAIGREIVRVTSERTQQALQVRHLEARRGQDPEAAAQIPSAQKLLAELDEQLRELKRRQERLTLTAPVKGVVLAPSRVAAPPPESGRLPGWTGTPLDPANRGCLLEAGTLFCLVGDPDRLQGLALVDQADVEFVQPGQRVRIRLDQWPTRTLHGTIQDIARLDADRAPRELLATRALPARTEPAAAGRPLATTYQARITLEPHAEKLLASAPGRARIAVAPRSLGTRLVRYLQRTFRFAG